MGRRPRLAWGAERAVPFPFFSVFSCASSQAPLPGRTYGPGRAATLVGDKFGFVFPRDVENKGQIGFVWHVSLFSLTPGRRSRGPVVGQFAAGGPIWLPPGGGLRPAPQTRRVKLTPCASRVRFSAGLLKTKGELGSFGAFRGSIRWSLPRAWDRCPILPPSLAFDAWWAVLRMILGRSELIDPILIRV